MTMPQAWRTIYIASGIWQGAGWGSIIYTAALSNASTELKEAAVIDGANIFQQIKAVEWPAIKSTVVIQFIMQAGNIMSVGSCAQFCSAKMPEGLEPEIPKAYRKHLT